MIKTQNLLWKKTKKQWVRVRLKIRFKQLGLVLGLGLFSFILSLPPLNRHVLCSRLYLGGKNMRKKCQMNNLRETKKFGSCITCLERSLKWYNWDVQGLSQLQHGYLIKKIQESHSCKWELRLPVSIKYSKKKRVQKNKKGPNKLLLYPHSNSLKKNYQKLLRTSRTATCLNWNWMRYGRTCPNSYLSRAI